MGRLTMQPIRLEWVILSGVRYPFYYDSNMRPISILNNYALYLEERNTDKKTIEQTAYDLRVFWQYLDNERVNYVDVDDEVLKDFREWSFARTQIAKNSFGNEMTAKRTTNSKLRRIYQLYCWLECDEHIKSHMIGSSGCQITSSLPDDDPQWAGRKRKRGKKNRMTTDRDKYPFCYRRVGESSSKRDAYTAIAEDRDILVDYFTATHSPDIARRNILIMDIARQVGWRQGSIWSLRCEQYSEKRFADAERTNAYWVRPDTQKFGYQKSYIMPLPLAWRTKDYIENERSRLVDQMGITEDVTQDRIFISHRDGKPLGERTLSQIFSNAFKAIECPRGSGIHSFRHEFTEGLIDREISARRDLGLDTSADSIAVSVATKTGHDDINSLSAYVSNSQKLLRSSQTFRDADRIALLEAENARLRAEIETK